MTVKFLYLFNSLVDGVGTGDDKDAARIIILLYVCLKDRDFFLKKNREFIPHLFTETILKGAEYKRLKTKPYSIILSME